MLEITIPFWYIITFLLGAVFGLYLSTCMYRYMLVSFPPDESDSRNTYEIYKKNKFKYVFLFGR